MRQVPEESTVTISLALISTPITTSFFNKEEKANSKCNGLSPTPPSNKHITQRLERKMRDRQVAARTYLVVSSSHENGDTDEDFFCYL